MGLHSQGLPSPSFGCPVTPARLAVATRFTPHSAAFSKMLYVPMRLYLRLDSQSEPPFAKWITASWPSIAAFTSSKSETSPTTLFTAPAGQGPPPSSADAVVGCTSKDVMSKASCAQEQPCSAPSHPTPPHRGLDRGALRRARAYVR